MMYVIGVAVLLSQLKTASAECAGVVGESTGGSIIPFDTCYLGAVQYYCENGVAKYSFYDSSDGGECAGDPVGTAEVDLSVNTAYCDADPCEVSVMTVCEGANCDTNCTSIPFVMDQCIPSSDEAGAYSNVYCDSSSGLMAGTYTDSECTDVEYAFPLSQFAALTALGGEEDTTCLTFDSDCEGSDEGDGDSADASETCPTGAVYAVLDDESETEAPYLPLGLCNKYGSVSSMKTECDEDGVPQYSIYLNQGCSGNPFMSETLDLSDDNDTDSTTFRYACNTDVDCTYARFTIIPYDEEAGECGGDDEAMEMAVFVGQCVSNGTASFMLSCDDTSVTRATYESLDCTGAALDEADMMYEFGGDERCPAGSVVNCYMTEPDFANGGGSSAAPKVVVSQVALVLVVMVGSLFM